jgi:hypothetical protein
MMRGRINAFLIGIVVAAVVVLVVGLLFRADPAAAPFKAAAEAPSAVPSAQVVVPPPVDIPAGIPSTMTVQSPAGKIIDAAQVDQKLLDSSVSRVVPGDQPALFVKDGTSVLPATHQDGTVVIGCHAYAQNPMVCNPLSRLTQDDMTKSQVILGMPGGQLVYTIEAFYLVDKADLPTQHALADNRPGRIELITCDLQQGSNTFQNRIVVACDPTHSGCGTNV